MSNRKKEPEQETRRAKREMERIARELFAEAVIKALEEQRKERRKKNIKNTWIFDRKHSMASPKTAASDRRVPPFCIKTPVILHPVSRCVAFRYPLHCV